MPTENVIFSGPSGIKEIIDKRAKELHLSRSAYLTFLVYEYDSKQKIKSLMDEVFTPPPKQEEVKLWTAHIPIKPEVREAYEEYKRKNHIID